MRRLFRSTLLAGASAFLLMFGAPAAFASATVSTNGGTATYTSSSNVFRVADTNCDNNDVYGQWKFTNSSSASAPSNPNTFRMSAGCNEARSIELAPSGNSRIVIRHCTDDAFNDTCSSWVNTEA